MNFGQAFTIEQEEENDQSIIFLSQIGHFLGRPKIEIYKTHRIGL